MENNKDNAMKFLNNKVEFWGKTHPQFTHLFKELSEIMVEYADEAACRCIRCNCIHEECLNKQMCYNCNVITEGGKNQF